MGDVTSSNLIFSASWHDGPPHYVTPRWWIHWMRHPHHVPSHLSSLACLTSVRSDCLLSCSLWRWHCCLTPDSNLSLMLSRLIGVELHSEEFSVVIHCTEHLPQVQIWNVRIHSFPFVQFKFRYMATRKQTYTRVLQCSHASVELAQARPHQNMRIYFGKNSC